MSFDPTSKRRTLAVREKVPRELARGFRDSNRMVDRYLLDLVCSLQRKHGQAFAAESGLRWMVWQDSGMMPGVGTIPAALARLERQGIVAQWWLAAGEILPDGSQCTHGTRLIWWPVGRECRRRLQARARERRASGRAAHHHTRSVGFSAKQALAQLERAFTPARKGVDVEAEREAAYWANVASSRRAAEELAAAWAAAGAGPPPE